MTKLIIFFIILTTSDIYAHDSSLIVTVKGYIFNFGGRVIFQSAKDISPDPLMVLNSSSFEIGTNADESFFELDALDQIGDTAYISIVENGKSFYILCSYFYCTMQLEIDFFSTTPGFQFIRYSSPQLEVNFRGVLYKAIGFWVYNKVLILKPVDKNLENKIYNYYVEKGHVIPKWLR